jgi:hypothetical protein
MRQAAVTITCEIWRAPDPEFSVLLAIIHQMLAWLEEPDGHVALRAMPRVASSTDILTQRSKYEAERRQIAVCVLLHRDGLSSIHPSSSLLTENTSPLSKIYELDCALASDR